MKTLIALSFLFILIPVLKADMISEPDLGESHRIDLRAEDGAKKVLKVRITSKKIDGVAKEMSRITEAVLKISKEYFKNRKGLISAYGDKDVYRATIAMDPSKEINGIHSAKHYASNNDSWLIFIKGEAAEELLKLMVLSKLYTVGRGYSIGRDGKGGFVKLEELSVKGKYLKCKNIHSAVDNHKMYECEVTLAE